MKRWKCFVWFGLGILLLTPVTRGRADDTTPDVPPAAIKQVRPEYPDTLSRLGNTGKVTLAFVVTETGEVRDPAVLAATHPDFIGPAIEAVQQWRFRPATKSGAAVSARVAQVIDFRNVNGSSVEAFSVPGRPPKEFPEELRYDTPPLVSRTVACVYPYELLLSGTKGEASVAFLVDERGMTREVTVQKATHPEFGAALKAAMEAWRFAPAQKNGRPSRALLARTQKFDLGNRDLLITAETRRLRRKLGQDEKVDFVPFSALDAPPKAIYRKVPVYPPDLREPGGTGTATVEFIIDRQGIPQFPRLVDATRPEFGWAALTAIREWRFSPVLSGGKAVDFRVRQPLEFRREVVPPVSQLDSVE